MSLFLIPIISAPNLIISFCMASQGSVQAVFSLKADCEPLGQVLDKLTRSTGYQIIVPEKWKNSPVTLQLHNVPVERGLRAIFRSVGASSHALVIDEKEKTITVRVFGSEAPNEISQFGQQKETYLPRPRDFGREEKWGDSRARNDNLSGASNSLQPLRRELTLKELVTSQTEDDRHRQKRPENTLKDFKEISRPRPRDYESKR
jgi:hypothetical protein